MRVNRSVVTPRWLTGSHSRVVLLRYVVILRAAMNRWAVKLHWLNASHSRARRRFLANQWGAMRRWLVNRWGVKPHWLNVSHSSVVLRRSFVSPWVAMSW